jgi:tetratricopeptide (TPR) repeat protein
MKKLHFIETLAVVTIWLVLFLVSGPVVAQDMEIEANFKKVAPEEEARLKEILATPLNKDALKANLEIQVNEKRMAAKKLALHDAEEAVLLEAKPLINTPGVVNDLANIARNRGDYAKAVGLHHEAVELAPKQRKPFFMVHVANDYLRWGRLDQARKELDRIFPEIEALGRERWGLGDQIMLKRSEQFAYFVLSLLEQRLGKWDKSIEAANLSEKAARKALSLTNTRNNSFEKLNVAADLANSLSRRV